MMPDCEFDSFLTIGLDGPALIPGTLSTVGLELSGWDESTGLNSDNGAVFFMDPMHGATTEPVVFTQLTVRAGSQFNGVISAQGKSLGGGEDWVETAMAFSRNSGAMPPPPPPPPQRPPPPPSNPFGPPPPAPSLGDGTMVGLAVTQMSQSKSGYATYQISVEFDARTVQDVYALFGEAGTPMMIPPAFQVPAPFGTDVGPVNPAFFPMMPDSQFDSFLTIGMDGPALIPGALSTIGIGALERIPAEDIAALDEILHQKVPDMRRTISDVAHGAAGGAGGFEPWGKPPPPPPPAEAPAAGA